MSLKNPLVGSNLIFLSNHIIRRCPLCLLSWSWGIVLISAFGLPLPSTIVRFILIQSCVTVFKWTRSLFSLSTSTPGRAHAYFHSVLTLTLYVECLSRQADYIYVITEVLSESTHGWEILTGYFFIFGTLGVPSALSSYWDSRSLRISLSLLCVHFCGANSEMVDNKEVLCF